jgi:hypothetical protein
MTELDEGEWLKADGLEGFASGTISAARTRVRGEGAEVRREARRRFLDPLLHRLKESGVGHISELADGSDPHTAGGPVYAPSLAEAIRLDRQVLSERSARQVEP